MRDKTPVELTTERLIRGIQSGRRIGLLGVDEEQIDNKGKIVSEMPTD